MNIQKLVSALLENDADDDGDDVESTMSRIILRANEEDAKALADRWVAKTSRNFPNGSLKSVSYQNAKSGIWMKLARCCEDDDDISVYIYDEDGDIVDGEVGAITVTDIRDAFPEADQIAARMTKDWSITMYRKSFE